VKTFEQAFAVKTAKVSELIGLEEKRGFLIDIPLHEQFEAALESRNEDWLDFSFSQAEEDEGKNDDDE
jgi:hypothetical protein